MNTSPVRDCMESLMIAQFLVLVPDAPLRFCLCFTGDSTLGTNDAFPEADVDA